MLHFDMSVIQSHEFIVGATVAAILLSALFASPLFRNIALAVAAGAIVTLYLQGGVANLLALSKLVETEVRSIPDFATGMLVGIAVMGMILVGLRPRTSS